MKTRIARPPSRNKTANPEDGCGRNSIVTAAPPYKNKKTRTPKPEQRPAAECIPLRHPRNFADNPHQDRPNKFDIIHDQQDQQAGGQHPEIDKPAELSDRKQHGGLGNPQIAEGRERGEQADEKVGQPEENIA